jgi:hypothetical protein
MVAMNQQSQPGNGDPATDPNQQGTEGGQNEPTAAHPASAISVSSAGFNGNLTTGDDTVQKVAQKVDDLVASGGATSTNTLLTAAATNTLAGSVWQTLTVTNAVVLLWTNTTPDTYSLSLDCGTNSVTWPTNWTWLLGTPNGTNIVVSWYPKPSSGWYVIGGGL